MKTSTLRLCRLLANSPISRPPYLHRYCRQQQSRHASRQLPAEPVGGGNTPTPFLDESEKSTSRFFFESGYALYAKRASKPFPPPFLSMPSTSFSDPLSTHNRSRDKREFFNGELIRGVTNGDDAVLVSDNLIAANDGVGAWAHKERGHAAYVFRNVSRDCKGGPCIVGKLV